MPAETIELCRFCWQRFAGAGRIIEAREGKGKLGIGGKTRNAALEEPRLTGSL